MPMTHTRRLPRALALTSLVLAAAPLLACGKKDSADRAAGASAAAAAAPPVTPGADTARPPGAGAMNDAQIAHVAVTANSVDSAAGVLAKQKGASKAVKDFA